MNNGSEGITHMYFIPGLTDLTSQKAQAIRRQAQGETTWVHHHHIRVDRCNPKCEVYEPQKEN